MTAPLPLLAMPGMADLVGVMLEGDKKREVMIKEIEKLEHALVFTVFDIDISKRKGEKISKDSIYLLSLQNQMLVHKVKQLKEYEADKLEEMGFPLVKITNRGKVSDE